MRPSYSSAEDMVALARQLVDRQVPLLNLLFHSSEAIVGGSPYNKTEAEIDGFFDRLGRFLTVATQELGARPLTLKEFRGEWVSKEYSVVPSPGFGVRKSWSPGSGVLSPGGD